jgi:hypothetical protein
LAVTADAETIYALVIGRTLIAVVTVPGKGCEEATISRAALVGGARISIVTLESPLAHAHACLTIVNRGARILVVTIEAVTLGKDSTKAAGDVTGDLLTWAKIGGEE